MNKIKFADLNLHLNTTSIQGVQDIEILEYLPIEEKDMLIQLALQNSDENGIYNLLKLKMYKEIYLIYSYTNLEFTIEEKNNIAETYNILASSGLLNALLGYINENEIALIDQILADTLKMKMKYRNTLAAVLNNFVEMLPINAKEAMEIINKFNPEDFQQVINFAKAANGGRNID